MKMKSMKRRPVRQTKLGDLDREAFSKAVRLASDSRSAAMRGQCDLALRDLLKAKSAVAEGVACSAPKGLLHRDAEGSVDRAADRFISKCVK